MIRRVRSMLFVPASRPDRFARALESGADAVCLDLEDAVAPAAKDAARENVRRAVAGRVAGRVALGVRINSLAGSWGGDDVAATDGADFVMIPKVDRTNDVAAVAVRRSAVAIWPIIETAVGLRQSWNIAAADGVETVLFGAFDYAVDVGCERSWEALLFARGLLAAACAAAGRSLLDAPSANIRDAVALANSTKRSRALGFSGRACIHPAQVEVVNRVHTPDVTEVACARRVLAAFDAAGGGAAQLDGRMIDRPVALKARRTLLLAGEDA